MSLADFSLEGKVAIVTGASRGIGRAISIGLAEHGADVVLAARKPDDLEDATEEVKKTGKKALAIPTNVRRTEELQKLVDGAMKGFGRIDVLVNNAGTNPVFGPIQDVDERAFDTIMNTNVKAIHFLSAFSREAMLSNDSGGSIINISSLGGIQASDVIGGYSVSKAALNMLTQVCARTWGKDGIRVNTISPGLVKTEFARALWDNEKIYNELVGQSALRRIGLPEDIVGAVVYLASSASSFVTGQNLILDGGRHL